MPRSLCPNCLKMRETCQDSGPCLDPESGRYANCFNRRSCYRLERCPDSSIFLRVLRSGCLSTNFTKQEEVIVRRRLRAIQKCLTRFEGGL